MPPKLYLIPTHISKDDNLEVLPNSTAKIASGLRCFFAEEEKQARRFLKRLIPQFSFENCQFYPLNEHTDKKDIADYAKILTKNDAGIISESGVPCVADPGADLVLLAHQNNIAVIPLVGPSSILLALMGSGLNGQNFAFAGYLPKEGGARRKKLKELERRAQSENQTQIFMETPYRNDALLEDILSVCHDETFLCVACDLTDPAQFIKTLPVKGWKKTKISFHKRPALFLIKR